MVQIIIIANDSSTPIDFAGTIPPKRYRAVPRRNPTPELGAPAAPKTRAPYDAALVLENLKLIRRGILERSHGAAVERCDVMIDHLENVLAES